MIRLASSFVMSRSEYDAIIAAVIEVINAAEEPRPVLLAFVIGVLRLLKRGRDLRCSYVGEEV